MDTSAFNNKIDNLIKKVSDKQKEMTEIYNKLIEEVTNDSIIWSKMIIEKCVEINHQRTLSLNDKQLRMLKIECKDLINDMPSIVEKTLDKDKYFIHDKSLKSLRKFYFNDNNYSNRLKSLITEPLSIIKGYAGRLLIKNNYTDPHNQKSKWASYNDGTIRYESKFKLNEKIEKYIDDYSNKSLELKDIINKIKLVENDKERHKAISKWQQIKLDD